MHRRGRTTPALVLVAALALLAVACSSATDASPGDGPAPSSAPTSSTTTTAPPPPPTWPLTALPAVDPALRARPAVAVKMDNSPEARPQAGINQADLVYELLVEGITRYALVFHSEAADPVGPVRSARSSDPPLLADLGTPLLAWSGGNNGVVGEVRAAEAEGLLIDAGVDRNYSLYYRDGSRRAPHNLYTEVSALWAEVAPPGATPPPPVLAHRAAGAPLPATAVPAAGVTIDFGLGVKADYAWDAERGGWDRFQVDQRHPRATSATVDQQGVQVAPANVVVLFLPYGQSPSDARSPMAISTGSGHALVLTGGALIEGTWSRPEPGSPWALADATGAPIALTPGRTWVALPEEGSTVTPLDAATAAELLTLRR